MTYKCEEDQLKNECARVVKALYKNEEDQLKNECARVVKTLNSYILDAQWQLTL